MSCQIRQASQPGKPARPASQQPTNSFSRSWELGYRRQNPIEQALFWELSKTYNPEHEVDAEVKNIVYTATDVKAEVQEAKPMSMSKSISKASSTEVDVDAHVKFKVNVEVDVEVDTDFEAEAQVAKPM